MAEGELFPYFDETVEFRASLSQETDRGCALMAAAYLSDQLARLFRSTFVDDENVVNELLKDLGSLGSFSTRIELAYAFGLLPANARRDLNLIRKIRNDFGHVARALTFEEPAIASRCRELTLTILEPEAKPRARFTNAVLGLCAVLHVGIYKSSRRKAPRDVNLSPKDLEQMKELIRILSELALGVTSQAEVTDLIEELQARLQEASQRADASDETK